MKSDLDSLMQSAGIDALLVTGSTHHNASMIYFTGSASLDGCVVIKKRGEPPILFHHPMERDEAALSGLRLVDTSRYGLETLLQKNGGNLDEALAIQLQRMLRDAGIETGKVLVYGRDEISLLWAVLPQLQRLAPGLELLGDSGGGLLLQAMATKDPGEVERIRAVAKNTVAVVDQVAELLRNAPLVDGILLDEDQHPLTIGSIKRRIELSLAERGCANPEGVIFSMGRDAGVPHSSGDIEQAIIPGQTIVFDIFPQEAQGGYFYDFTRTWCVGNAPAEVLSAYTDVRDVFNQVRQAVQPGMHAAFLQTLACDLFEARGHATLRSHPGTQSGYVHGLGHGVGLTIHQRPNFGPTARPEDVLVPGTVFTLEPGLYYPDRGFGIRLEDTFLMDSDGRIEPVVSYPYDLIL